MSSYFRDSGKYVPAEIRHRFRRRIFVLIKVIFISFFLFQALTVFFIGHYSVEGTSMNPLLESGEHVFASPLVYGPHIPFSRRLLPGLEEPARGDLAVYLPPEHVPDSIFYRIADPLVRFFTLRKVYSVDPALRHITSPYLIKRIIGVPGDTVYLRNGQILIESEDVDYALGEFEKSGVSYTVSTGDVPFFLGSQEIALEADEFFILGDNRRLMEDSRYTGPVMRESLYGKVLLRFRPLSRFGRLYDRN